MHIPAHLRKQLRARAADRCEYCRLSQARQEAVFHIDHIVPVSAEGPTIAENLAVACVSCSLRKGARQDGVDPISGAVVPLFNPRTHSWSTHFRWDGLIVAGITATGRGTVEALKLNRGLAIAIRREEAVMGRHPPPD